MGHQSNHSSPCANCGHTAYHSPVVGCLGGDEEHGCACTAYIRNRVADAAEGRARAQEGGERALSGHAMTVSEDGRQWREKAEKHLDELIDSGQEFTADDLTDKVGPAPSRNAIGGLFRGRKDQMHAVGYGTSTRPEGHGRVIRIWMGSPTA